AIGRWRRQRLQAVQRVVDVAAGAALRVGKAGTVRGRVIAVAGRQHAAGEERVLRGRARQPPHVVERELVGARGIGHLGQPRIVIVGIIHRRGIRIRLLGQPVQLVVSVGYELVLAVGFAGEIADVVVAIGFRVTRREAGLGDAAKRVVGEACGVLVGVLDAGQVVFGVVPVGGHIIRGIGYRDEPVGIVVSIVRGLPVLILH